MVVMKKKTSSLPSTPVKSHAPTMNEASKPVSLPSQDKKPLSSPANQSTPVFVFGFL